jgi:hypothetical protein
MGYDVWMGSFRGVYPRKCTEARNLRGDYWKYSLDDIGKYDVAAFIKKIVHTKKKEF